MSKQRWKIQHDTVAGRYTKTGCFFNDWAAGVHSNNASMGSLCCLCVEKVITIDSQVLHADMTETSITISSPPLLPLSIPPFYHFPSPSAHFALALSGLPSFVKSPDDQTGISGGVASFVCQATGEPKPRITWMKKGKKVSSQRFEVSPRAWLLDLWNTHIHTHMYTHNYKQAQTQNKWQNIYWHGL